VVWICVCGGGVGLSGMDGCVGSTEWYGGVCVWVVPSGMEVYSTLPLL
jgi:hypothetical protein